MYQHQGSARCRLNNPHNARAWGLLAAILIGVLSAASAQADDIIFQNGFELSAPISPDPGFSGSDAHLAVSSGGRVHMVYLADAVNTNSSDPIRYGECAANCTNAVNWQFITLGFDGTPGAAGGPRIALTAAGHPRVLWYEESSADVFRYAACDAGCAALAHWSIGTIALPQAAIQAFTPSNEPFALDGQDHPHFFTATFNGLYYASCTSFCANGGPWSFYYFGGGSTISGAIDLHFYGQKPLFVDDYPDA
ncbi:MAG: hypothetical protein L0H70_03015, partial [Xanthomonadales bacterium]|nr:hypothetical protein [Xanthomonadales bacterium]